MENKRGKLPKGDQDDMDPELENYYVDIKKSIQGDYASYIQAHPEIRQLLNDFMSSLLLHKPENVYMFTKDYFTFFNKSGNKGPKPWIVCGPSGVGKGTIIKKVFAAFPDLFEFSVSYTTRKPREGEVHGKDYFFLSKDDFLEKIKDNDFWEFVEFSGNFYGTSKSYMSDIQKRGKICVLDIDLVGAEKLVGAGMDVNVIFLIPPSFELLKERLVGRGTETAESLQKRLTTAKNELEEAPKKTFINKTIMNDNVEDCYNKVVDFLRGGYPELEFGKKAELKKDKPITEVTEEAEFS